MLTALPAVAAYAGDVKKLLDITGAVWYVVCLPRGRGGKGYELSEKTGHVQRPR